MAKTRLDRATPVLDEAYRTLREGCGLVERAAPDRIELRGEDRVRFLNGLITCELKSLSPGSGVYGFLTSQQGKILADAVVLALEDRSLLELPPGKGEEVAAHLGKYIVADRVEIAPAEGLVALTLAGTRLSEALPEVADLPEVPWAHREGEVAGIPIHVVREGRLGLPAVSLRVEASRAGELGEALLGRADGAVLPASEDAIEIVRVEAGVPRYGLDFTADNFPQETGIDDAVSYTKGCYLGQEVVARIHYRGQVNRSLRGLRFEADEPPSRGTSLLYEGRPVGKVGSSVGSLRVGRPIGLAILHRRGAEPGTRLELETGGRATVTEPGAISDPPATD